MSESNPTAKPVEWAADVTAEQKQALADAGVKVTRNRRGHFLRWKPDNVLEINKPKHIPASIVVGVLKAVTKSGARHV